MPTDDRTALIDWLRDRDEACPSCSYNLRGLTEPRCPECGEAVGLSVKLLDSYATAWITLAVATCGSAGLGIIFACILLRVGLPHEGHWLDSAMLFYICMIPMPWPLLKTRRHFQRLPKEFQWKLAGIVVFVAIAALAILCGQLR